MSRSRELSWLAGRMLRSAAAIIVNSRNTAGILVNNWSVTAENIRVLHPGVDALYFQPAARDNEVRRRLGWNDRPVILTVGRLQKRKGQEQLIRALPELRQRVPDVLYAIVGDGADRPDLERVVNELRLHDCVQMHGALTSRDLLHAYQQCDLFALANLDYHGDFEGFGIVLLEAQACGKPVVAGDSGGTAETMQIDTTGRIVPHDSPKMLIDTLSELLLDGQLRAHMGGAARDWIVANFQRTTQAKMAYGIFNGPGKTRCQQPTAGAAVVSSC